MPYRARVIKIKITNITAKNVFKNLSLGLCECVQLAPSKLHGYIKLRRLPPLVIFNLESRLGKGHQQSAP